MCCGLDEFPCNDQALFLRLIVGDLLDEQVATIEILPGVVGAGVVPVVVKNVCGDILLRQKIQQPRVQIDLTVQIQGIHVFNRNGRLRQLAVFRFCLQVEGVILPCEASTPGDVIDTIGNSVYSVYADL